MDLKIIEEEFSVCLIKEFSEVDVTQNYIFLSKTDQELSLVCPSASVPSDCISCEMGWRAIRIQGTLDFSLIGILSKITTILADSQIGVFVVSTYLTDYILVKKEKLNLAMNALSNNGYQIE